MSGKTTSVAVIVPVYNDLERLRLCLSRIAAQDYDGEIAVVVVDNASSIDLRPALPPGDPRFRLIREEKRGSYAARNAGIAVVDADVVAFTDADCRPLPDWISNAVARLRADDAPDAVGGAIRLVFRDGGEPVTGPELYEAAHDFDQRFYVEQCRFAATANLVVTRETLERVGPFDSDLQSGGDDDWGRRLHEIGGRMDFGSDVVVEHPSRSGWRELTVKSRRVAQGIADLTAGQPVRADLSYCREEIVLTGRVLRAAWGRSSRSRLSARTRYSAAYLWVVLTSFEVRAGARVRQRRTRRVSRT